MRAATKILIKAAVLPTLVCLNLLALALAFQAARR